MYWHTPCSQYNTNVLTHRMQSVQYTCTGTPNDVSTIHMYWHTACSQYSTHVLAHRMMSVQYICTDTPHAVSTVHMYWHTACSQYSTHVLAHHIQSTQSAISNKTPVHLPLCTSHSHFQYIINSKATNCQISAQRLPRAWYATAKNKIWTNPCPKHDSKAQS